jgi:two-component system sensor histidine kinase AlgZ
MIRQNSQLDPVPDFRNLGVIARILIAVNLLALGIQFYAVEGWVAPIERYVDASAVLVPVLIACLVLLFALTPWLQRLRYAVAAPLIVLGAGLIAVAFYRLLPSDGVHSLAGTLRAFGATVIVAGLLIAYLRLRAKAYSPALAEARLQALQARIRPHFLFNSLNAVLSLIRRDPQRAERALEDLADLFRTLMSDAREFVRMADELALLERYAALEQLRLGERLRIVWELDAAPENAMLPPLILQPLLENAVYHGVEPGTGLGEIVIAVERRGDRVRVRLENPYLPEQQKRAGNRMALENVRERLQLFFDAEAKLETRVVGGRYCIELDLPYREEAREDERRSAAIQKEAA